MCPHCNKAKDPFVSSGSGLAWLEGMPCPIVASQHPPNAINLERLFSCACDHSHVEICHYWTEFMQHPPHLHWFPQADVCREEHKVAHSGLKQKRKISAVVLTNGQQHPNTWKRHWQLCLGTFTQLLDGLLTESTQMVAECGLLMENTQMRTQAVNICSILTFSYAMKMEQWMVTVLWCRKNDKACLPVYLCCNRSM